MKVFERICLYRWITQKKTIREELIQRKASQCRYGAPKLN
ncbi:hypothetical protein wVul_0832 [Wolbachia endosymbiont of Armadillidium vulgare str. wVulC]|nr:hypothetical protein wVul_1100 [Wolbachia endosymbiont of Armadillidium vulgare str. wVulC]KLT22195.1 hypothetical protein wVul_1129 [Wolbachia endosymbiont of Armadillidium vulgare str. wVulC]KLT22457.1 hypothetical protein wVul_0822 [Wolbachia endosymbiont of Armadillidium vulgare str. wVulC]KLT22467.1 hypothetical protein wVul_0832 [Wolbachia endosymbiont of Armadillidium vulgare str. wVulC]